MRSTCSASVRTGGGASSPVDFTVDGNFVEWQKWQFRIAFDPFEGLVLHQIAYNDDDGRLRPILHRASINEMVVPYGDPDPLHGWKNAFDAGEWGLGRMTQSLRLGCDCLGEIRYFDATLATEHGKPWVIENAICMHEEDYGILWKHVDLHGGTSEVRRSRRLVISTIGFGIALPDLNVFAAGVRRSRLRRLQG